MRRVQLATLGQDLGDDGARRLGDEGAEEQRFELAESEVYRCEGPVNVNRINAIYDQVDRPDLKFPLFTPRMLPAVTEGRSLFDAIRERVSESAPLRRTGSPEDIADACVGVIGARYMTGQVIAVDGGTGWIA